MCRDHLVYPCRHEHLVVIRRCREQVSVVAHPNPVTFVNSDAAVLRNSVRSEAPAEDRPGDPKPTDLLPVRLQP